MVIGKIDAVYPGNICGKRGMFFSLFTFFAVCGILNISV